MMKSINLKSSLAHYLAKSIEDNDVVVSNLIEKNGFTLVRMIVDNNGNVSLDAVHHVFDFFPEDCNDSIAGVFKVVPADTVGIDGKYAALSLMNKTCFKTLESAIQHELFCICNEDT